MPTVGPSCSRSRIIRSPGSATESIGTNSTRKVYLSRESVDLERVHTGLGHRLNTDSHPLTPPTLTPPAVGVKVPLPLQCMKPNILVLVASVAANG